MNMPYTPDAHRHALSSDRHRAARPLGDLVARERADLAAKPLVRRPDRAVVWRRAGLRLRSLWRPTRSLPAVASLTADVVGPSGRLTSDVRTSSCR